MDNNRQIEQETRQPPPSLPPNAQLPINRCNLPAVILGSLTFQEHPVALEIDGIRDFHAGLFRTLDAMEQRDERAQRFIDYMTVRFLLEELEEAGLTPGRKRKSRINANYLRMVRGWSFDSDGREGAILKRWVESRFGLLARHHAGPLLDPSGDAYHRYISEGTRGLYATNALEAQLDLLFTYCQYELTREHGENTHLKLYRGINRMDEHEILETRPCGRNRVLLNNLNSFTSNRERADEFGDYILMAQVPTSKVFFYNKLLPGMLKGEDEYVVIGGAYEVCISSI
ncbi:NAD(+)--dinitrogen-reductase ADP-D-ribosyltransferase [Thiorhodococcus drewsii AZ1]|uniref:NAD(+)--dinitrogen-reductase ADP-D-ribosyltransferase n=1 Tax=Thiorhodococcus drewsii AZ1 TaxID=765913 RepID=G2E3P4_9GAMM|nr:NAD(+)--dinitrogen-reductase ADP-D-ribosyltransferase [Thiorhodococcus drewsii]EGV30157.1 NAD(+)--dinitrogen-reductase ADP-D-ribosyltransferase [Thiorhodococcus drewsii AZ1]